MTQIINTKAYIPVYQNLGQDHIYILLTSLNLGGAEKIVSEQLWANHYSQDPKKVTLLVIYDKHKEHSIPPSVNVVRLNNNIKNGEVLLKNITFEGKPLVCHLINDDVADYLFSLNLKIHLVVHNDRCGWGNTPRIFDHENIISLISVCHHVTKQLQEVTTKNIITVRHQINQYNFAFNQEKRDFFRNEKRLKDSDILIGMTGRICEQKNYFLALDVIAYLSRKNPNYKMIILGGFEKSNTDLYFRLLKKANQLGVQKHIFIEGFKDNASDIMNMFDIGLNVSHYEGLSMATQELMLNGLQMVLSRVSGQPEINDIKQQLHFFDIPNALQYKNMDKISIDDENDPMYLEYVSHIASLIEQHHSKRLSFSQEESARISIINYGSSNLWSLFNYLPNIKKDETTRPAFITSNLNLGGAQRSLVNLLVELKQQEYDIPLILLNQSNYTHFYNQIIEHDLSYYLCHSKNDVFVIFSNLMNYIVSNKINKLILWNVDSKIKLLLAKLFSHYVDIIDVSPGDYCFKEMDDQRVFQDAIYYTKEEYFGNISCFVSKYNNDHVHHEYKQFLKNETVYIPNGVILEKEKHQFHYLNGTTFKFLVCGRITKSKHIEEILESFYSFYQKDSRISIDFYGSAESYNDEYYQQICSKYQTLIDNQVINFKGNVSDPKMIMSQYHAIIILGTHQGCPNMVLESASFGIPCITNDSGGTKEIIDNTRGILIPEYFDHDEILKAMMEMKNDYSNYCLKAESAFEYTKKHFSMSLMAKRYLKLIYP